MKSILPANTAEVLITQKCNLNCSYCFEKIKTFKDIDLEKTIEILTKNNTFYSFPITKFYILGGEPLMNLPFLVNLIEYVKNTSTISSAEKENYIKTITQGLTTNGILIDKYVDILKKYKFSLQISLDGPEDVNDACRVDFAGKGHFKKIEENLALCREKDIPYYMHGALSVKNYSNFFRVCKWFLEQKLLCLKQVSNIENILGTNFLQIVIEDNINDDDIDILLNQFKEVVDFIIKGTLLKDFSLETRKAVAKNFLIRNTHICGAGNSMFSYDDEFNVYSCHRTNTGSHSSERRFMSLQKEDIPIDYKLYEQFQSVYLDKYMIGAYWDNTSNLTEKNQSSDKNTGYQVAWCPATNLEYSENIYYMPVKYNVLIAELQYFIPKLAEYYEIDLQSTNNKKESN